MDRIDGLPVVRYETRCGPQSHVAEWTCDTRMSGFTTRGLWVLTGGDTGRKVGSQAENGTDNSKSSDDSTKAFYSKINVFN